MPIKRDLQAEIDTLALCVLDMLPKDQPTPAPLLKIIHRIQDGLADSSPEDGGLVAGAVSIYTDGSCDPNPGSGGWSAIVLGLAELPYPVQGSSIDTTNNRMELAAAIGGLDHVIKSCIKDGVVRKVIVNTDSKYVMNGITSWIKGWKARGWKRKEGNIFVDVKNRDLWEKLDAVATDHRVDIHWKWVRGHNDDQYNEMADEAAFRARVEQIEYLMDGKPL